jgi:hypothetical protein
LIRVAFLRSPHWGSGPGLDHLAAATMLVRQSHLGFSFRYYNIEEFCREEVLYPKMKHLIGYYPNYLFLSAEKPRYSDFFLEQMSMIPKKMHAQIFLVEPAESAYQNKDDWKAQSFYLQALSQILPTAIHMNCNLHFLNFLELQNNAEGELHNLFKSEPVLTVLAQLYLSREFSLAIERDLNP